MEKKKLIENALRESKDFAKAIRYYLYGISKERPLTTEEQNFLNQLVRFMFVQMMQYYFWMNRKRQVRRKIGGRG